MKNLIEEFNNMNCYPLFEIEHNGEYYTFDIQATNKGLEAGSSANIGFLHLDKENLSVEWDDYFSLDEHLQELYEKCFEHILSNEK